MNSVSGINEGYWKRLSPRHAGWKVVTICRSYFWALLVFLVVGAVSNAQQARPTEFQVKAAYLFNFGKFVRWPGGAGPGSLEICVLGKNPLGSMLEVTVKGESIDGKQVRSRTISNLQEASSCNILFVSGSEEGRLPAILPAAKRGGILTVSDIPHFAERGGMIEFVNQQDRIRFTINTDTIEGAGLSVSSELLKVAVKVIRKNTGGGN